MLSVFALTFINVAWLRQHWRCTTFSRVDSGRSGQSRLTATSFCRLTEKRSRKLMDANSPLFIVVTFAIIFASAEFLLRRIPIKHESGRYDSIDGLRGLMAVSVFIHHARFWYSYTHTGQWGEGASMLFDHMGLGAVGVFFMITAFLFFSKLLSGSGKEIDWTKLFVGRATRLIPMYVASILVLVTLVLFKSGFQIHEGPAALFKETVTYLFFAVGGQPDINGLADTSLLVAGVYWSLKYEWLWYFALPLMGIVTGVKPSYKAILIAIPLSIVLYRSIQPTWLYLFLGGVLAAFLCRLPSFTKLASSWVSSLIVIGALVAAIEIGGTVHTLKMAALYSVAFCLIAGGNSLFGVLTSAAAKRLGEISYSVYLLHGAVLSVTFLFITGGIASTFTPLQHWLTVLVATPVLLVASMFTFLYIEKPGMALTTRLMVLIGRRSSLQARES